MPAGSATCRSRTTRSATCRSAQGDLAGGAASYRASLAICERLAAADPGNAGWQRDLSVSHNKIGDVLVGAGRSGRGADQPTGPRSRSASGWPRPIPAMPAGSATSRSRTTRSATCWSAQGDLAGGADQPTGPRSRLPSGWPRPIPATPAGSATCRSRTTGSATCSGAGRSGGGADSLPDRARHRRAAGQGRPRQCRLAARPLGLAQQDRRRAGGAGRSGGALTSLPGLARDPRAAGRRPIPATPAGSATSRCRTTRSATCWWRRAIWRRR